MTLPVARAVRSLILAALTVRLIDEWWSFLPAGVMENLRNDLGISYAQAGSLIAFAVLSGLIGGPLGAIADRADRRATAVAGGATQTLGMMLFAAGTQFVVLAVGVILLGAASDLVIRPLEAALAESMSEADLENAIGRQHFLSFIGDFLGPLTLGGAAALGIGWRPVFWATAAALGLYTCFLFTVRFPPRLGDSEESKEPMAIREVIKQRSVWRLVLLDILLFPLDEPIAAFAIAAIAIDQAVLAQGVGVGYVVGGLVSSALVDRTGLSGFARRWGAATLVIGAASITAAVASLEQGWLSSSIVAGVLAAIGMCVVGLGMGFVWGDLHHQQLTVIPGRSATVASIVGTCSAAGALWPWLGGRVADRFSIVVTLAGFIGAAALLTLALATTSGTRSAQPSNGRVIH
jgi:MFS transporter, FSR family, fosmidomycin resistance protein